MFSGTTDNKIIPNDVSPFEMSYIPIVSVQQIAVKLNITPNRNIFTPSLYQTCL